MVVFRLAEGLESDRRGEILELTGEATYVNCCSIVLRNEVMVEERIAKG